MKKLLAQLVTALCVLISCLSNAQNNYQAEPAAYEKWVSSNSFPYQAPELRKNIIIKNYGALKEGQSKAQVMGQLGSPDFSNEMFGKGPGQRYIGTSWSYVLEKPDPNLTNIKRDIVIQIYFDHSGRLKWASPSNVVGLTEIGKP